MLLAVILEHHCIANGDMYCVTLKFLKEAVRRKRPCLSSGAVLHDNAQPHAYTVQQTWSLVSKIWTILHTVWLWHLAIIILFPASKEQLSEHHFTCTEDVKPTTITQLTQQQRVICVSRIHRFITFCDRCLSHQARLLKINSNTFNVYCQFSLLKCYLCFYRNCKLTF